MTKDAELSGISVLLDRVQSGSEYDVSCQGHTGFDASMTSQIGDFRTSEAQVLKFGFFKNRILVKVMNTQRFQCPLSIIVHVNIFRGIL